MARGLHLRVLAVMCAACVVIMTVPAPVLGGIHYLGPSTRELGGERPRSPIPFEFQQQDSSASAGAPLVAAASHPTTVTRIAGSNRYATAAAAAAYAFPAGASTAIVASGENWYDALLASTLAGALDAPVLLTQRDVLPAETATSILALGVTEAIVIGDAARVGASVASMLASPPYSMSVERVGGADKYETSRFISERVEVELGSSFDDTFFVVSSSSYWGALIAAPVAYAQGWPIVFLDPADDHDRHVVPVDTRQALRRDELTAFILWWEAGEAADFGESLYWASGGQSFTYACPSWGTNPYATAAALAEWTAAGAGTFGLASTAGYHDALAAGSLLGSRGGAVLATHSSSLPFETQAYIWDAGQDVQDVLVLGGTGVVAEGVAGSVAAGIPLPELSAPVGLVGAPGNGVNLAIWDEHPSATSYKVYRAVGSGGTYNFLRTTDEPYMWDETVTNGVPYSYRVTAVAETYESPLSGAITLTPDWVTPERVCGSDRYATAVETSRDNYFFADKAVLANGADFPDALAASALCGVHGAPLLLTGRDSVPPSVIRELDRLGVQKVFIVGGESVVSPAVEDELLRLGYSVKRLGGSNRYDTAARIALHVRDTGRGIPNVVYVVRGTDFPDALSISPFASWFGVPVLLAEPDHVPEDTRGCLVDLAAEDVIIIGGESAVSDAAARTMYGPGGLSSSASIYRVAGDDRFETSAKIVEGYMSPEYPYSVLGIATGHDFPDALGGGVACGSWGGALLLVGTDGLHPSTRSVLRACRSTVQEVQVYGGEKSVPPHVMNAVAAELD